MIYAAVMPRPAIYKVTSPKSWAVLIAPVRLEIVEAMRMIAPCSIAAIADALDRPADALYRHVEKLRGAGIVVESGSRQAGRRTEQTFDLVADDFRPSFRKVTIRAANDAYNETVQSILKIASRSVRDSAAANQLVGIGDERNIVGKIEHAWLSHDEFLAVRSMMMGIKEFMDARKQRREDGRVGRQGDRLYLAAFVALPVTRKRGAKARLESGKKKAGASRVGKRASRARAAS